MSNQGSVFASKASTDSVNVPPNEQLTGEEANVAPNSSQQSKKQKSPRVSKIPTRRSERLLNKELANERTSQSEQLAVTDSAMPQENRSKTTGSAASSSHERVKNETLEVQQENTVVTKKFTEEPIHVDEQAASLNGQGSNSDNDLKRRLQEVLNEHTSLKEEHFLPLADMDKFSLGLCSDNKEEDLILRHVYANEDQLSFPIRMKEALASGDLELAKEILRNWTVFVQEQQGIGVTEAKAVIKYQLELPSDEDERMTPVILWLAWERSFLKCYEYNNHPWCNLLNFAIVELGLNVNERSSVNHWTPLMVCTSQGTLCQFATLMKLGADATAASYDGLSALHLCTYRGFELMVKWIMMHGGIPHQSAVMTAMSRAEVDPNYKREIRTWMLAKRELLAGDFRKFVEQFAALKAHKQLCPVNLWPAFASEWDRCNRLLLIDVQTDRWPARQKPLLFLAFRTLNKDEDQPGPVFQDKRFPHELIRNLNLSVNGSDQPIHFVDDFGWLGELQGMTEGGNRIQISYDREKEGPITALRRRSVIVAQVWLCSLIKDSKP